MFNINKTFKVLNSSFGVFECASGGVCGFDVVFKNFKHTTSKQTVSRVGINLETSTKVGKLNMDDIREVLEVKFKTRLELNDFYIYRQFKDELVLLNDSLHIGHSEYLKGDKYPLLCSTMERYIKNMDGGSCTVERLQSFKTQQLIKFFSYVIHVARLECYLKLVRDITKLRKELSNAVEVFDDRDLVPGSKTFVLRELEYDKRELWGFMDQVVKKSLTFKGLSVVSDIFSGFDTEYKNLDLNFNELVSVQLSVCSRTSVKVPVFTEYKLSTYNVDTGEVYIKDTDSISNLSRDEKVELRYDNLEKDIHNLIKLIRMYVNYLHDFSLKIAESHLEKSSMSSFTNVEKGIRFFRGCVTPIKNWIAMTKTFSIDSLAFQSNALMGVRILEDREKVLDILRDVDWKSYTSSVTEVVDFADLVYEPAVDRLDIRDAEDGAAWINREGSTEGYSTAEYYKVKDLVLKAREKFQYLKRGDREGKLTALIKSLENDFKGDVNFSFVLELVKDPRVLKKRGKLTSFTNVQIPVYNIVRNYVIAHNNVADLSMMCDYHLEKFRRGLNIVHSNFVNIKGFDIWGTQVYFRDSMLLGPAGSSLASLGKIYGPRFYKIDIDRKYYRDMRLLHEEDPKLFVEYALKDSIIALVHGVQIESKGFELARSGIPLTISSMAKSKLLDTWRRTGYKGYTIPGLKAMNGKYDMNAIFDPTNLRTANGEKNMIPFYYHYFSASLRGGRNEVFTTGFHPEALFVDYDLTSAYTTVMSGMYHPDYRNAKRVSGIWLEEQYKIDPESLRESYTAIDCWVKYPRKAMFPNTPVQLDRDTTVYTSSGRTVLRACEYILAKNMGATIFVKTAFHIPANKFSVKPFEMFIKEVQTERRKHPKGSFQNLYAKLMGNAGYGLTCMGLADKRKLDVLTGETKKLDPSQLTNAAIAGDITARIRCTVTEAMWNAANLETKMEVMAVATDGFHVKLRNPVRDWRKLEQGMRDNPNPKQVMFYNDYRKLRLKLTNGTDGTVLEVKNEFDKASGDIIPAKGDLSWANRSHATADGKIIAVCGMGAKRLPLEIRNQILWSAYNSPDKAINFIQQRFTSAGDIFKSVDKFAGTNSKKPNKNFTPQYLVRQLLMRCDNRREYAKNAVEGYKTSKPFLNPYKAGIDRLFASWLRPKGYLPGDFTPDNKMRINSYKDLAAQKFLRVKQDGLYGITKSDCFSTKVLAEALRLCGVKISRDKVGIILKRRVNQGPLPDHKDIDDFVENVKELYPEFDSQAFKGGWMYDKPFDDQTAKNREVVW